MKKLLLGLLLTTTALSVSAQADEYHIDSIMQGTTNLQVTPKAYGAEYNNRENNVSIKVKSVNINGNSYFTQDSESEYGNRKLHFSADVKEDGISSELSVYMSRKDVIAMLTEKTKVPALAEALTTLAAWSWSEGENNDGLMEIGQGTCRLNHCAYTAAVSTNAFSIEMNDSVHMDLEKNTFSLIGELKVKVNSFVGGKPIKINSTYSTFAN